jgi:Flp pilus assembly protein TadD, contains TPR repeats
MAEIAATSCVEKREEATVAEEAASAPQTAGDMLRSLKPHDVEGHFTLAGMLNQAGDFNGARFLYHRCLVIDPNYISAAYNLANLLYTRFHEYSEAEVFYRRAIDVDATHLPSLCNYGSVFINQSIKRINQSIITPSSYSFYSSCTLLPLIPPGLS